MNISYKKFGFICLGLSALAFSCVQMSSVTTRVPTNDKLTETTFLSMPPKETTTFQDEKIWQKYCQGERQSSEIPKPNYTDSEVRSAVAKLAMVAPLSYYFYSGPLYIYQLKNSETKELVDPPSDFPNVPEVKNGKKNANAFLTVLCGEFRDRPTLIKNKINWVLRMRTLPVTPQKVVNLNHELWSQMSAHSYTKYIRNTRAIFTAKQFELDAKHMRANIGQYSEQLPVEPFTICETKFIFKKYVETDSLFSAMNKGLDKYRKEYTKFKSRCPKDDLAYFYDFRGDSNFKPNSPESNGMIWFSTSIANSCVRKEGKLVLNDTMKDKFTDPDICEKYFTSPFSYRWSAARAGLATWLLHDSKYNDIFANQKSNLTIVPHLEPNIKPFGFMMKENSTAVVYDYFQNWQEKQNEFWLRPDLGFNEIVGFSGARSADAKTELAFERLRDAVNRHTDWYASAYDDGLGKVRDQAYSPFVASSYEMSASDGFTSPGVTVNSPADGCKHWMFVFKLKADQWYTTKSVMDKKPIDFNHNWFDETSLGTNHLADSEHALDRLGTALEGEMDSILYLHNITRYSEIDANCGHEMMK